MKLEKHISDLLYRYDLVIVPGFGGIIGRRKPARIDRDTYIFSPPYKDLSFNIQLQQNDGLLANYIADVNGISYEDSLQAIQKTVREWRRILQKEKRLKLDQIGIFSLIGDQKILFLALTTKNYLTEAYGLKSFVYKPLVVQPVKQFTDKTSAEKNSEIAQSVEIEVVKQEATEEKTTNIPVQSSHNSHKFWKYAAVFVVGLGLFTAGIGILRHRYQVSEEPVFQKATFVLKQDFPPVNIANSRLDKSEKNIKPVVEKYFIIGGAFRIKANAEKEIKRLKKSGYPAKIVARNKFGLWMVAYQSFATQDEAVVALSRIKKQHSAVWLYSNK